jgi:four helix bundle protein
MAVEALEGKKRQVAQSEMITWAARRREGSGSGSDRDFKNFLNIARRSAYENANIVLFLARRGEIDQSTRDRLVERLRVLYAKISAFANTLG